MVLKTTMMWLNYFYLFLNKAHYYDNYDEDKNDGDANDKDNGDDDDDLTLTDE